MAKPGKTCKRQRPEHECQAQRVRTERNKLNAKLRMARRKKLNPSPRKKNAARLLRRANARTGGAA